MNPVFSQSTGIYGPEITPFLDTFHVVFLSLGNFSLIFALVHLSHSEQYVDNVTYGCANVPLERLPFCTSNIRISSKFIQVTEAATRDVL